MNEDRNDSLVGEINTDNAENQVWLVKVPKFLVDHWKTRGTNEVGKIHIKGGNNIFLSVSGVDIYEEFQLTTSPIPENQPIKIFSQDKDGALALEGNIGLKCDLRMNINSATYRNLCKKRTTLYNTRTSVIKKLDDTKPIYVNSKFKLSAKMPVSSVAVKSTADKMERKSEDEVIDMLLNAFEENKYYDLKTLVQITEQPMSYLKQILLKTCDLNRSGPNKNMYQIKPEYTR
ncbi:TFIIF subunit [Tieghemostelium lacteum]|uniref:TFIIF subunit n=1 Tax=Tieghemostelium lacteum TaxID=361077 RepID=A0A151ZEE5_TIELA|nr:TFIIF subunit [Tieghemostelium lacteum]|eukprot:KYQ92305.1 TFIIF subunit [Tieghemostelium lacteum]